MVTVSSLSLVDSSGLCGFDDLAYEHYSIVWQPWTQHSWINSHEPWNFTIAGFVTLMVSGYFLGSWLAQRGQMRTWELLVGWCCPCRPEWLVDSLWILGSTQWSNDGGWSTPSCCRPSIRNSISKLWPTNQPNQAPTPRFLRCQVTQTFLLAKSWIDFYHHIGGWGVREWILSIHFKAGSWLSWDWFDLLGMGFLAWVQRQQQQQQHCFIIVEWRNNG